MVSHSNGSGCPCKKNCHPFEWLGPDLLEKKIVSCLSGSSYPCKTKLFSVGTAQAICLKKTVSRSNSSGYPFEKNWQPFKSQIKKSLAGFPSQNNFLTSHLCQMICYSPGILEWSHYELCLQTYHEQPQLFFYPCLICFVIHSAIPFRRACLPLSHLFTCPAFVYRALFVRNIFE